MNGLFSADRQAPGLLAGLPSSAGALRRSVIAHAGPARRRDPRHLHVSVIEDTSGLTAADLPELLASDAVWTSAPQTAAALEDLGVPHHRIRVSGGDDLQDLAAEMLNADARATGRPLVWRGPFGRTSSLALVNSQLSEALTVLTGRKLILRTPACPAVAADGIGISHSWPAVFSGVCDGPQVMILPWEFGAPPAEWVSAAARLDAIWTPSAYVRDGYIDAGIPAGIVDVVANGVDLDLFCPGGPALDLGAAAQDRVVFCFVGGSIPRKGVDLLVDAWQQAFSEHDPVLLLLKDFGSDTFYRNGSAGQSLRAWASQPGHAPVIFNDEFLPADRMPGLYRAADVMALPYRGEGFCLPALEALACGVPVIHPAVGPTNEFCGPAGVTVPARRVPSGPIGLDLSGPGYLHEVSVGDLADTLRRVASDHEARAGAAAHARAQAEKLSWAAAADEAAASLQRLDGLDACACPARQVRRARLERRRLLIAVDTASCAAADVADLCGQLTSADPVTVALFCPGDDPDSAAAVIVSRLTDAGLDLADPGLCDLTVACAGDSDWYGLILAADAVLAGDAEPPRHARRVITADAARAALGLKD